MAVTTYSHAQIASGFSGYFDTASNVARRCMQKNSVLFLLITGTAATIKCDGGSSQPFVVTVDGATSTPTVSAGTITLFTGLADARHTVSLVPNNGYTPTSNWFIIAETQLLSVTGAAPAMMPIPMDYVTWAASNVFYAGFNSAPAGGNITPNELMVSTDTFSVGTISFMAACDSIYVFAGDGAIRYAIDDGAIQMGPTTAATTERHLVTLATGLDPAPHKYTIWHDTDRYEPRPQAVACLNGGAIAVLSRPSNSETVYQYGDSITEGQGGTAGGVDIFQVGLGIGRAVAKYGIGGLSISGLKDNVPGYFLKSPIPTYAMIAIGRNDNASGTIQADYTACIQAFLTAGCTKIICRGILPENAQKWTAQNAAIQAAVASFANPNIQFMDVKDCPAFAASDGTHPTNPGYVTIANFVTPLVLARITPAYALTIDANGATSGTPPATADHYAGAIALPLNTGSLAKTNHTLNGWNTQADGGGTHSALGGAYTMPAAPTTLYAEWLINPPVNTVVPATSGPAVVGQQITGSNGDWANSPAYTYQWQSLTGTWGNIAGATSINYTPVTGDVGHVLRLVVTATNAGGNASKESLQTSTISAAGIAGGETSFAYIG